MKAFLYIKYLSFFFNCSTIVLCSSVQITDLACHQQMQQICKWDINGKNLGGGEGQLGFSMLSD